MPNTLAHVTVQSLLSRTVMPGADIKWIGLGCLLPDLPWIGQRLLHSLAIVDPINLRLYVIIQSSLIFSLLPAAAVSLQCRDTKKIFFLLSFNCLLHLLLDPCQIKWANGSLLLAPFSWQMTSFGTFWPEQLPFLLLTLLGLILFPLFAWQDRQHLIVFLHNRKRQAAGSLLLTVYLLFPLLLLSFPLQMNSHFAATLKSNERTGMVIAFDRRQYQASSHTLDSYSDEQLQLTGSLPEHDAVLSLQGEFIDNHTILVSSYHVHSLWRDYFSIIGIILLLGSWLVALLTKRIILVAENKKSARELSHVHPGSNY
jgi:hypothetical protein